MANVFKNYTTDGAGTSAATVYTVGSNKTAVIIGCNVANVTTSQIAVDIKLGSIFLVKGVPIPANTAFSVLDGKIIAEAADAITVQSDTADSVDVVLSVLEQDV
jgi:hypothetical protein|tara:strand:+ start:515 stop:826 length:312 start_codon:yes stop_codon:yes gene_type:complete